MKTNLPFIFSIIGCILFSPLSYSQNDMLHPLIINLELNEAEKHDPKVIKRQQNLVIDALKDHIVTNIKRYEYLPQLALTVDDAGKVVLENLTEVRSIHTDGLAYPLSDNKADLAPANQTNGKQIQDNSLSEPLSPCNIKHNRE